MNYPKSTSAYRQRHTLPSVCSLQQSFVAARLFQLKLKIGWHVHTFNRLEVAGLEHQGPLPPVTSQRDIHWSEQANTKLLLHLISQKKEQQQQQSNDERKHVHSSVFSLSIPSSSSSSLAPSLHSGSSSPQMHPFFVFFPHWDRLSSPPPPFPPALPPICSLSEGLAGGSGWLAQYPGETGEEFTSVEPMGTNWSALTAVFLSGKSTKKRGFCFFCYC